MSLRVTSDGFGDGQEIPRKYTADGENRSPPLRISGIPEGAKELAVIVDDPDAPRDEPFVHWVMYKIRPDQPDLPEAISTGSERGSPREGKNSFGKIGYGGPSPPPGHGTHHYHFHVYALDQPLQAQQRTLDKTGLLAAMSGHVIDEGEIVGTYERS